MTTDLQIAKMVLPIGSLDAYIQRVNTIPLLTLEEEQLLTQRWYEQKDLVAARRLVMAHLRYVVKVAKSYQGYGLPLADLVQEGNVGLMKAVKRFDPAKGARLVTFAVHWIKAEIHEYVIRNWRIVKIATTKAQRKLFFNLKNYKKQLGWLDQKEVANVAADLNVSLNDVTEMESRLGMEDESFSIANSEMDIAMKEWDPADQYENTLHEQQENAGLQLALSQLDGRSQDILQRRWLSEERATLQDLADQYSISAERVRQLEKNALDKLKKFLTVSP